MGFTSYFYDEFALFSPQQASEIGDGKVVDIRHLPSTGSSSFFREKMPEVLKKSGKLNIYVP